ncbi:MAG: flavin reductase family protein [Proteobacteria bacterium]|nr:flavin reductase family protein [Pseudomonadota bacterium]
MRRLTTTVSVISCAHGDAWFGMTATAVTSVCAEPPAILVCINGTSAIHSPLISSKRFCVNMLRVGQEAVSQAFSGKLKGMDRFTAGSWSQSDGGLPYLETAQANLFCRTEQVVPFGTHSIFIGAVEWVQLADRIEPLLYEDGRYVRSAGLLEGTEPT